MSILKDNKDQIASFAALVGTTLSIIALGITAYSLRDTPKSANLVLQISSSDRFGSVAVTYNGGDAPCAEFKLTYPESIGNVEQIIQYQESVITNAKIQEGKVVLPPFALDKVGKCSNGNCTINGTFLSPNQAFALKLPKKAKMFKMTASCIGDSNQVTEWFET
jgi:hypothetical protein